jgi:hypothetical protein
MEFETTGNIYIAGFPKHYGKDDIIKLLEPFGKVVTAKVIINLANASSKCFGFARLAPIGAALAACEALNGSKIDGCRITVRMTDSKEKFGDESEWIFVRGIKVCVGPRVVKSFFSKFGKVEVIKIKNSKKKPRGYLIKFENKKQAKDALNTLNNQTYENEKYPMFIQYVRDPENWWNLSSSSSASSTPTSSPSSSPDSTPEKKIQEEESLNEEEQQYDSWKAMLDDDESDDN